jgi:hypothetical protein
MNRSPISPRILQVTEALILLIAGVFFTLHAVHLSADFPNHSPWMDWAKYTDEGWYGDAAIRHFQRGQWYVPGDFNPAAALPVWPLLEAALFRFTGVSLTAARALTVAIFGLILLASYALLRRWQNLSSEDTVSESRKSSPARKSSAATLAPAVAVLLLAVSPFCYVFTRIAILEPLLILFTLLALLAASNCPSVEQLRSTASILRRAVNSLPLLALGLLLPLMILTKTTAIFLFPAIAWLLWARSEYRFRTFLRLAAPAAALATVAWLCYYVFAVRPHFLTDYRYLFSANGYTGITPSTLLIDVGKTIADGRWIGNLLCPMALLAVMSVFLLRPLLLRNPLVPALLLWAAGYAAFLVYHNNLQPRYYLVLAIPLTLLVPVVLLNLSSSSPERPASRTTLHRLATAAIASALAVLAVSDASQTLHYVRTPDYAFSTAAAQIRKIVSADSTHNPLILSISGSQLSLMTGLPSICDDFGTMDLAVRVKAYHPGWYITWNQVDDDKMDALTPVYHLQRVASFPAFDDPERNLLIVYRLDPATTPSAPLRPHRKATVPHLVRTGFGEKPTQEPPTL